MEAVKHRYKCECGDTMEVTIDPPHSFNLICTCFQRYHADGDGGTYKIHQSTQQLYKDVLDIYSELQSSMTVRQVYYQLVGKGYPKTELFYRKAQQALLSMRRTGILPYSLVSDGSRYAIKQRSYSSVEAALEMSLYNFRLDVWSQLDYYVEVWMEKIALASIFEEVTREFDVPLYVSRGFASESFVFSSAQQIKSLGKPTAILIFTDHDPSGLQIDNSLRNSFDRFGCTNIEFIRCALTRQQIEEYNLPGRPTKKTTHSKEFDGESTELDALNPNTLRKILKLNLYQFIPPTKLESIKAEENILRSTKVQLLK